MYFIYILFSENFKKSYVGSTDNLERRLKQHNNGTSNFTKKYKPWKLIHSEKFQTRDVALQRERYLKSRAGRKLLKGVIFNYCQIV